MPSASARPELDDLLGEEAINDPHGFFARLREYDPVYWNERWNGWIVTRYDDVVEGFRDHDRLSSDRFAGPFGEEWRADELSDGYETLLKFLSGFLVWKDPPYHKRVRALVSQAFTATSVDSLRPRIEGLTAELAEPLRGRERVDFLSEFAFHLPVVVICEFIGVPSQAREDIKRWSDDLGGVIFVRDDDDDRLGRAERAVQSLVDFLRPIIAQRRREPREDLLSAMLGAEERGDFLSEDEVIGNLILMVFAGHETTMNLMANGVVAFNDHPDEWRRLQREPQLARSAVEEMLRYDGPIRAMARWAKTSFEWHGREIAQYDRVLLHQAAANRDPAAFAHAERMDIGRRPNRHVGFGYGIHNCLGGPLARLETLSAFSWFARELDRIEVIEPERRYHPTIVSRSLRKLHVRFHER
ncbi:MAG TPA: cytochrome P450 [Solirubrobacteraceae bacterium]|jgi:cytochrome P450|nr:cytochrome P450 [Solirubrobacteraceae bacterium]